MMLYTPEMNAAMTQLKANASNLPMDAILEVSQIIGADHWDLVHREGRLQIGKDVFKMQARFGLVHVGYTSQNHATYRRAQISRATTEMSESTDMAVLLKDSVQNAPYDEDLDLPTIIGEVRWSSLVELQGMNRVLTFCQEVRKDPALFGLRYIGIPKKNALYRRMDVTAFGTQQENIA